jgi:hypothetical protein
MASTGVTSVARGQILRTEYEDVMARMRDADPRDQSAFLDHIQQTIDPIIGRYSSASLSGRKLFLEGLRKSSMQMWKNGDWARSLGLAISCLNAESRVTTGEDAEYVRTATGRLIREAWSRASQNQDMAV